MEISLSIRYYFPYLHDPVMLLIGEKHKLTKISWDKRQFFFTDFHIDFKENEQ